MSSKRIILPVVAMIGVGCLILAITNPDMGIFRVLAVGMIFGTLFGQTSVSAAWSTFGPLPLVWRLPLSLLWLAALVGAFLINVLRDPGPIGFIVVLSAALLVQWLLVQGILWCVAIGYGWRLRFLPSTDAPQAQERQFGIRQLMIVTAIIGVLLGAGRIIVTNLPADLNLTGPDVPVLIFLGVTAVLTTIPLIVAALLPRWAIASCVVLLLILGVATAWEFPLLIRVDPNVPADISYLLFCINYVAAAWILAFVVAARLCGYGTARRIIGEGSPPK